MDIQANGGLGFSFNDLELMEKKFAIKNPIWQIEKAHIAKGVQHIIPTFITDSNENIENLMAYIVKRISDESLSKLSGIHFEGNFASNVGTHNEAYNRLATKENIQEFIKAIEKPFVKAGLMRAGGKFPLSIQMTIAPDLFFDGINLIKDSVDEVLKLQKRGIKFFAGHTDIICEQFKTIQNYMKQKGSGGFIGISHFNNAMLGGHFKKDKNGNYQGLVKYLIQNDDKNLKASIILDGIHVKPKLDLIPTFLLFADKDKFKELVESDVSSNLIEEIADSIAKRIIIISDCGPVVGMDKEIQKGFLSIIGGNVANVHMNKGSSPSFSWYNYTRTDDKKIKLLIKKLEAKFKKDIREILESLKNKERKTADSVVKFLMDLQIKDKGQAVCYNNLSASAVTLKDCMDYFRSQKWLKQWLKEVKKEKSKSWEICKDVLIMKFGVDVDYINANKPKIQKILERILKKLTTKTNIDKMTRFNAIEIFGFDAESIKDIKYSNSDLQIFRNESNIISKRVKEERREALERKLYDNIYDQLYKGLGRELGLIDRIIQLKNKLRHLGS